MRSLPSLAALALVAALAPAGLAQAQAPAERHEMHGAHMMMEGTMLSVSAEGLVAGAPDMATVSLGVTTDGATAAAAMSENARSMTALTQALRRARVAERDIQTSNISLNPQYQYVENEPPRMTGYQANNTVSAKVRDLDRLGAILDAAVGAGGNTLNGVSFSYQNPDAALDAARRDAVARARARATLYAEAAGMTVGRIVSISEGGGYAPPMPMLMRVSAMDTEAVPISPGEIETRVVLNVVFQLR